MVGRIEYIWYKGQVGHLPKRLSNGEQKNTYVLRISLNNLHKPANKILHTSKAKYPVFTMGDIVRNRVSDVDRSRRVGRNVLTIVIEITLSNLYKLETILCTLNQFYLRI